MTVSHNILVCTEDAVLAKKVRILLARDECEVEILSNPRRLERRLSTDKVTLLVVSGRLATEDAVTVLNRLSAKTTMPPTLILGSEARGAPSFAKVITDPGDTQSIYRLASEALAAEALAGHAQHNSDQTQETPALNRGLTDAAPTTQRTPLANLRASPAFDDPPPEDALDFGALEFPSTEQIESNLDASSAQPVFDQQVVPDTRGHPPEVAQEDITVFDVASFHASTTKSDDAQSGPLDPPRFARVLFQAWTTEAQGALVVTTPEETLTIYFEGGVPVHVESNLSGDLFGRNLVQKGRLSDVQYGDAAKLSVERGLAIGHAVVELGFLSRDAYGRELGEDAHDRVVRRLGMRGGTYDLQLGRRPATPDRPFRLSVGRILVEGLKRFCDDASLTQITGDVETRYFRLRSTIDELTKRFPLTEKEKQLLAYSGRAYNVTDASELAGVDARGARVLMALLITAGEIDDFTPGVAEFESRIREERQRQGSPSTRPAPDTTRPETAQSGGPPPTPNPSLPPPTSTPSRSLFGDPAKSSFDRNPPPSGSGLIDAIPSRPPAPFSMQPMAPPLFSSPPPPAIPEVAAAPSPAMPPPIPPPQPVAASSGDTASNGSAIPPMPVPMGGSSGRAPRPVVFSPPLPRSPDGQAQETPERTRSRQHFQRGVTLLGQGNFDDAEEAFRDAIALCSEEHVYLIGLARALYYNPAYAATGKVPVLRTIVDRAGHLAPEDGRVLTLTEWVRHAETQLR